MRMFVRQYQKFSTLKSKYFMDLESQYGCHNYHSMPVVVDRAQGIYVYDQEGKQYMDFIASYSAVNQGHVHPKILKALIQQAQKVTITSRAVYNNKLGLGEKYLSDLFGYQKVLFMNSGAEGGESAVKLARRWAYNVKGVQDNQARVLFMNGNFWGRTIAACGSSDDPLRYKGFGPFNGLGFDLVDYNSTELVEQRFRDEPNYAAIMLEPIQGEKGMVVPSNGYLQKIRELCTKYNVLMIADEIQSGLGRAGNMLASDFEGVRPDVVVIGKSLAGGFYPVSAVLCDDVIMNEIRPGEHGSTFGGNPLGQAVMVAAMDVIQEEGLVENSRVQGEHLKNGIQSMNFKSIKDVRGRGLMIGLELDGTNLPKGAVDGFCYDLIRQGLISKPTHGNTIRLSPPLIIQQHEVDRALDIIHQGLTNLEREYQKL